MASPLGTRLADARRQRGWSLRDVEQRLGIRNAHLSQIETGAIERPDLGIIWELSLLYDLDFDELLELAGHASTGAKPAPGASAAFRAYTRLTPEQQREALEFMDALRRQQGEQ